MVDIFESAFELFNAVVLAPYSALILIDLDLLLLFRTHCNATCGQIFIPIDAFTYICVSSACEATSSIYIC